MCKPVRTYHEGMYTVNVYKHENGGETEVYIPDLTEEEQNKRHKELYRAAERFAKHVFAGG